MADETLKFSFVFDQDSLTTMETKLTPMINKFADIFAKKMGESQIGGAEKSAKVKADAEDKEDVRRLTKRSMIQGMMFNAIGNFLSPTKTFQEKIAGTIPAAAGIMASSIGTKVLGTGISEDMTRRIADAVEGAVKVAYERMSFVSGNAANAAKAYAAKFARVNMEVPDETIDAITDYELEASSRVYDSDKRVAARVSERASKHDLFQPADIVEGITNSLKQLLGAATNIPEDAMEDIREVGRRTARIAKGEQ